MQLSESKQVQLCALLFALVSIWASLRGLHDPTFMATYDFVAAELWQTPWRLLTAHLLHLDGWHLALNVAMLLVLSGLFARHYQVRSYLNGVFLIMVSSALLIAWLAPEVRFVGLSVLLHGLLLQGLLLEWRQYGRSRWLGVAVLALLLKVGSEALGWQWSNPLATAGTHLWLLHSAGLVAGILAFGLHQRRVIEMLEPLPPSER